MASQPKLEEAKAALHSKVNGVLRELEQSGVPESSISDLKASLLADEASSCAEVLLSAQAHSRCYPYMDTAKLMEQLETSQRKSQDYKTTRMLGKSTRTEQR